MKHLSVLGSTGSIGKQTLDVCKSRGFVVEAIAAGSNVKLLEEQARAFQVRHVSVMDTSLYLDLKSRLADTDINVHCGMDGLCELAQLEEADTVVNSVIGMVGLTPTLAAIHAKKKLALANKETLVAGGELVMRQAAQNGVDILPVDSEHSAIFQCLQGNLQKQVKKLILTASGGPFFGRKREELENVTIKDALSHPNWSMGAKITVDSATLMNKGLELIEAVWLFNQPAENIDILVQRESIIHSMVEYDDNSVIAQLSVPDMRLPIQYALTYPDRFETALAALDLADLGQLTFARPDEETFQGIRICREAINRGGLVPAVVNGANEEAVGLFLAGKLPFLKIPEVVEKVAGRCKGNEGHSLEDILIADQWARQEVHALLS